VRKIGVLFLMCLLPAGAFASYSSYGGGGNGDSFRFGWSVLRYDHTTAYSGQSSTDTQVFNVVSKLGYQWSSGLYLGAAYESSASYLNATGTPTPEKRISYGPAIGYGSNGFFIIGSYFSSTTDTKSDGSYFSGGTGYEVELGYNYPVTSNFYLGVSLVYNNYTWTNYTVGTTVLSQNNSQTDTYPALGLGFTF